LYHAAEETNNRAQDAARNAAVKVQWQWQQPRHAVLESRSGRQKYGSDDDTLAPRRKSSLLLRETIDGELFSGL